MSERRGRGRPKGSKTKKNVGDILAERGKIRAGLLPLPFLLQVMRNEIEGQTVPIDLRIDAAKSAAPYMHRRQPAEVIVDAAMTMTLPVVLVHTAPPEMIDGDDSE